MALVDITDLPAGTPADTDVVPYVDLVAGVTKKAVKSDFAGSSALIFNASGTLAGTGGAQTLTLGTISGVSSDEVIYLEFAWDTDAGDFSDGNSLFALKNETDAVTIIASLLQGGGLDVNLNNSGQIVLQQGQTATTKVFARSYFVSENGTQVATASAGAVTFTTAYTGSWDIGLSFENTTIGVTLRYRVHAYKR